MDNIAVAFGKSVRELRLLQGISQEELADKCGFARSYMSRIERGKGNPSLVAIKTIADALEVNIKALL